MSAFVCQSVQSNPSHARFICQVALPNGNISHTCPAALGYSFAAGTTDGPGQFDFTQVAFLTGSFSLFFNQSQIRSLSAL